MTAKKYVENATSDRLVVFQRDIFKDFVNQICKEQREMCGKEVNYPYRDEYGCVCDVPSIVLNAKQPEV
jgi:hypothetical protein